MSAAIDPASKEGCRMKRPAGSVATFVRERRKVIDADDSLLSGLVPPHAIVGAQHDSGASVTCDACVEQGACCKAYVVRLQPWESGEGLDLVGVNGVRQLRRNPDGACVHLVDNRCSVHANRPQACRTYDCREMMFAGLTPRPALARVVKQWEPSLETAEDREMYITVLEIARLLTEAGITTETAAACAVFLASHPPGEIAGLCDIMIERFGRGRDGGPPPISRRQLAELMQKAYADDIAPSEASGR